MYTHMDYRGQRKYVRYVKLSFPELTSYMQKDKNDLLLTSTETFGCHRRRSVGKTRQHTGR